MSKAVEVCLCPDCHSRMGPAPPRYDIISKKLRETIHCPVCRRWSFE